MSCPITVLTGDGDPRTTLDEAKAWAQHTTAILDLRVFACGHFFISDRSKEVMQVLEQHFQAEGARAVG